MRRGDKDWLMTSQGCAGLFGLILFTNAPAEGRYDERSVNGLTLVASAVPLGFPLAAHDDPRPGDDEHAANQKPPAGHFAEE